MPSTVLPAYAGSLQRPKRYDSETLATLPDISGKIDTDGDRTDIEIPISDILDNLSAGYIGEFWARRGPWRLGWRTMYLGVETEQTTETVTGIPGRPPIIGKHKLQVENDLFTSDLIASYELNEHFDVYTGIRRTGNKTKFRISALEEGLVELNGSREQSEFTQQGPNRGLGLQLLGVGLLRAVNAASRFR